MSLEPMEEIGKEIHTDTDQFFRFEGGNGKCIIEGTEYEVKDGDAIVIPAGAKHQCNKYRHCERIKNVYYLFSSSSQRWHCTKNKNRRRNTFVSDMYLCLD